MGNSSQKPADYLIVRSYRPEDWKRQADKGSLQIWSHKQTHEKVEVYPLQEIPSIEDMRRYEVRSSQQHLVRALHIAASNGQMFCFASQFAQLLIEHIPIRLNMVCTLDIQEALTILYAAFKGFELITKLFGTAKPSEQLIGFNSEGKPKVWLNKQFHLNFCEAEIKYSTSIQSQEVRNIYKMVACKVRGQAISEDISQQILSRDRTYREAAQIIEEYALTEELSLKRYLRVDVLERQFHRQKLNRHSSTDNFGSQQKLTFSRAHQFKTPVIHRYQSCESLHQKLGKQQSNLITDKKSIAISGNPSFCSLSPANHNYKSIPKVTFNNTYLKSTQETFSQNGIEVFRQLPPYSFTTSAQTSKHKLHKISTNQIPAKMPQVIFAKTNRAFHHKKIAAIASEVPTTEINQITSAQNKKSQFKQSCQSLSKGHKQRTEQGDRGYHQTMEATSPGKATISSEHSIIDRVSKLQKQNNYLEGQFKKTVELQLEGIRQDIEVSGVFRQPHQQEKQAQVGEPPMQEQLADKQNKVSFALPASQKRNMPINFQSFAPSMENISFAPKFFEQEANNELAQTSKSVDIEEEHEESFETNSRERKQAQAVQLVESGEEYVASDPSVQEGQGSPGNQRIPYSKVSSRQSNQEPEQESSMPQQGYNQNHPLYNQCTPVESKFHIVLKKDSNMDGSDNEHSNRISAFAQVELQDAIKNEFNSIFQQEGIRLNRVSSQYEMLNEKHSEPAHSQRIMRKDASAHVRSHINLGQPNKEEEDFLDVKFMEKSLDLRYRDAKNKSEIKEEEDELNISKLDEKLEKFSNSRISVSKQPDPSEKSQSAALPHTDNSKLVSELAIDSERFESRKVTSIQYEPSYLDQHREASKDYQYRETSKDWFSRAMPENRDKIQDFYQLVQKQRDRDCFGQRERVGYMTVQEDGFQSKPKAYQSLQRVRDQVRNKTYQVGESWRKNSKPRQYMNSARKDSALLLEERYEKYVKQSQRQSKRQSTDYESTANHDKPSKARQEQRYSQKIEPVKGLKQTYGVGKRVSYDHLRSILWN